MRVVALSKQLNNPRHLRVISEEHETKSRDSSPSHIVRNIGDRNVQQLSDRLVVACAGVCETDGEHGAISKDRILNVSASRPIGNKKQEH